MRRSARKSLGDKLRQIEARLKAGEIVSEAEMDAVLGTGSQEQDEELNEYWQNTQTDLKKDREES